VCYIRVLVAKSFVFEDIFKRIIRQVVENPPLRVYLSGMSQLFAPFKGSDPAAVTINGHRIIILGSDRSELEEGLELVGGDRLRRLRVGDSDRGHERVLQRLAYRVRGGVVIAPPDTSVSALLDSLREQLPWVQ
jgi:hypothetical protein